MVKRALFGHLLPRGYVFLWLLISLAILALWQGGVFAGSGAYPPGGKNAGLAADSSLPSVLVVAIQAPSDTSTPTPTRTPAAPTSTATSTPAATATPTEWFDPAQAIRGWCGGVWLGDTTGKPNRVSQYNACAPQWDEGGPEDVYLIHKWVNGDMEVGIEGLDSLADMDVFLLKDPYASSCIQAAEFHKVWEDVAPGIYYLVVDGFGGASGAYRLTLSCGGEPTPTATATFTPQFFRLPMAFKPKPATPTPTFTLTPTAPPYRVGVNCGGGNYAASDGITYVADRAYTAGGFGWTGGQASFVTTSSRDILDTIDDPLYQTQRYGMDAYRFDVPRGRYRVLLRFAEIFPYISTGQRVFDVQLEGAPFITNLDLLTKNARNRAYDQELYVDVVDGRLDITFTQSQTLPFAPALNAVSVEYVGSPSSSALSAP